MRIHDRYLVGAFLRALAIALVAFMAIFLIVDLFEKIDTFVDHAAPALSVLRYLVFKLPQIVLLVLPVAVLLGCLFGVGSLARNNELLPLANAGVSPNRVFLPIYALGIVITALAIFFGETVLPKANERMARVWRVEIQKQPGDSPEIRTNVNYLGEGGRLYLIGRYDAKRKLMRDVVIQRFANDTLVERLDAREADWEGERWNFRDGFLRTFTDGREEARPFRLITLDGLVERPEDFAQPEKEPDEMSRAELSRLARKTIASGGAATRELVELHMKLSFPVSILILVILGTPIAAKRRRSGLAVSFALAVGIAFVYYGAIRVGEALGLADTIPPLPAAWLGNALFGALAATSLIRARA